MGNSLPSLPSCPENHPKTHFRCQTLFCFALPSLPSLPYNPNEVSDIFQK